MGAADEISLIYAVDRAYFPAFTARYTLIVINSCEVIYYLYGFGGASLFAFAAGYTATLTELANLYALIMIIAFYYHTGGIIYKMDNTVGAGFCAKTAADTFLGVYLCYTALSNAYGISGADLSAVAVSKAGEGTESVTGEGEICRLTGLGAGIDILSLLWLASAVTGNVGNLLDDVICLDAHNRGNSFCGTVTAGGTKIRFIGYTLGKSLCIALAARKAASTAVCSGKAITYPIRSLVLLDTEITGSESEKERTQYAYAEKENNRYKNLHINSPFRQAYPLPLRQSRKRREIL